MSIDFTRTSRSEAETALIGAALGELLRGGDVVLIDGPLGAGKTTLIRSVAAGMGVETGGVASPTFVLSHEYRGGSGTAPALIHVDAYRLRGADELDSLGWDTVKARVNDGTAALVVEWAERIEKAVAREAARLRIEHMDETSRELFFSVPESWKGREGFGELVARKATVCPITGKRVEPDSPTYPFADERAKMADLGRWFGGSYTISREVRDSDLDGD